MSSISAIAGVQARIGSIEQRLGIVRPVAADTASASKAATNISSTATYSPAAAGTSSSLGAVDPSGSFEAIVASIESALGTSTGSPTMSTDFLPDSSVTGVGSVGTSPTGSLSPGTPYADLFQQAGERYGIDPKVLAGVAYVESRFQTDVVSSAGAVGMMQFMPSTAAAMGVDPRDPASAIDGAARYLRTQVDRFGSIEMALAAYNVGPGAMANAGGIQPGSQAERYVTAVLSAVGRV
jgi:soluble lytic murein transglycosylase-like protein